MAQSKLELLLELKNRLKGGLAAAKNTVFSELKEMKSKLNDFSSSALKAFKGSQSAAKDYLMNMKLKMTDFITNNTKAFKGVMDEIPILGRAVELLANPYALAAAAALAFAVAGAKAVSMALDWERTMAKVNVTAQLSKGELNGLSKQLLYIGAHGSTDLMQVPEAFNTIISAVGDVNKSLEILPFVLKGSKAGFTDMKVVADAATGVMASSGENVTIVFDTLFATLNKGKAEFQDVAQYLPEVIPGAKNAGFALTETAGAFAFLTASGIKAMQASTGLKNAFKALSNPEIIGKFKKMGIDIYDASGKTLPLLEIVQSLNKEMTGLTDEQRVKKFSELGLDMEAASSLSLMSQKIGEFKTTLDFVNNGQGQFNEAIKNAKTSTDEWAEAWNKVKMLAVGFGQIFIPIIDYMGENVNKIMDIFVNGMVAVDAFINGFKSAAGEIGKFLLPIGEAMANVFNPSAFSAAIAKIPTAFAQADIKGAFNKGASDTLAEYLGKKGSTTPTAVAAGTGGDGEGTTPGGTSALSSGPAAQQSKSIVINIDAVHKGDNKVSIDGEGMTLTEFERKMNEVLMRTIRNVEASY